jgi:hypothetical protein
MKCKWCGINVHESQERECLWCWELRTRIEKIPEIALKIIESLKEVPMGMVDDTKYGPNKDRGVDEMPAADSKQILNVLNSPKKSISEWQKETHSNAVLHGWYDGQPRGIPELLCLIHSEVSEALEAHRDRKPELFAEELADVAIRLLDMAEYLSIDLESEIAKKHETNIWSSILARQQGLLKKETDMPIKHTFKIAGKEFTEVLSYSKAIRKHCLDCCAGSSEEVKICHLETCPLHPFRFGKDPGKEKRILSDERKKAMAERFADARRMKSIKATT